MEKARRPGMVIVDEGHVSNILSAFERPLSEGRMLAELGHLELPDLVLRVTLPDEERTRRLLSRGYFSRSGEGEEYLRRWELAMRANEELVARLLPRLGVLCVHLDGRATIDAVHSAVRTALSEAGLDADRTSAAGGDQTASASTSRPWKCAIRRSDSGSSRPPSSSPERTPACTRSTSTRSSAPTWSSNASRSSIHSSSRPAPRSSRGSGTSAPGRAGSPARSTGSGDRA